MAATIDDLAGGATPSLARRVEAARLDPFESHAVFTVMLHACARPGRAERLPAALASRFPAALAPVLALADVDVPVAVVTGPSTDGWDEAASVATGAALVDHDVAGVVAVLDGALDGAGLVALVETCRRGTAIAPERAARLSLACGRIDTGGDGPGVRLQLRGPGIPDSREVAVDGIPADVFHALARINEGTPGGIDTWLAADDGTVVAIPRSTRVAVVGDGATPPADATSDTTDRTTGGT